MVCNETKVTYLCLCQQIVIIKNNNIIIIETKQKILNIIPSISLLFVVIFINLKNTIYNPHL